ncbi:hypothetical protein GV827_22570 [Sulfitobacter sp. JBTF-M27]|uniref:DUF5681 domain-containing protein n=1 Tax=Sulfitobacter sediminilitoris TaxID=2698830 RepID=A0A6P0CKZ8_9RHOB|nr:DUF5681 domain-containing protein [Sulfitobacter sediminilitoris]NEK25154.1 hypothetical protein [Sulfitobacter sediminilitoris]
MSARKEYEVGYGKPPSQAQFEKGKSGNPKGRPKGTRNFATDLDEVLAEQITITEGGQRRKVSSQLAALKRLKEKALKGDARALDRLLELANRRSSEIEGSNSERVLKAEEDDILERYKNDILNVPAGPSNGEAEDEYGS